MKRISSFGVAFILLVVLVIWMTWDSKQGLIYYLPFFGKSNLQIEESFEAESVRKIEVHVSSSDVAVVRGSSNEIEVRLEGRLLSRLLGKVTLRSEQRGDTLQLGVDKPNGPLGGEVDMTVELPEAEWESIRATLSSGDVMIRGVDSARIDTVTISGDIVLNNSAAEQIEFKTSSGDIEANGFQADRIKFLTGSGDVQLRDGEAVIVGKTGSGEIHIEADELQDTELTTGSGDVVVSLGRDPESLAVDFQAGSGDAVIRWGGFTYEVQSKDRNRIQGYFGSGDVLLKVRTGSGDFVLE